MFSRPYKAYGGVVQLSPKEAACQKEVLSSPRFAKVEWPLSLLAKAYASRTTGMAGNATDKDWADRRRLIAECMARKTAPDTVINTTDDLVNLVKSSPYLLPALGVIALIVVGVIIGKAIR